MANKDLEVRRQNRPAGVFDLMPEFEDMVERFFGTRFNSLLGDWPSLNRRAVTDIQENDKCYILSAEVPGIPKEDIEIKVDGNLLTVRAEHKEEAGQAGEEQGYRRQYRSFQQSFTLPSTVDPAKIEAHYEDGILEVMLPKGEQAQPKRVEVQTGQGGFRQKLMGMGQQQQSANQSESTTQH